MALERDHPAWQVWTVRTWDGTAHRTVWCARRHDDQSRVVNADSPDHLAEYITGAGAGPAGGACYYCGRAGEPLKPCCATHPARMVCADVASCRDVLLAHLGGVR